MFKFINEISENYLPRLTDIQKSVLLLVFVAQTPQLAFEDASGSEYVTSAKEFLYRNGLILIDGNSIKITSQGYQSLIENGLIDDMEQVTDTGTELLEKFNTMKSKIAEDAIPFKVFKGIMNVSSNNRS